MSSVQVAGAVSVPTQQQIEQQQQMWQQQQQLQLQALLNMESQLGLQTGQPTGSQPISAPALPGQGGPDPSNPPLQPVQTVGNLPTVPIGSIAPNPFGPTGPVIDQQNIEQRTPVNLPTVPIGSIAPNPFGPTGPVIDRLNIVQSTPVNLPNLGQPANTAQVPPPQDGGTDPSSPELATKVQAAQDNQAADMMNFMIALETLEANQHKADRIASKTDADVAASEMMQGAAETDAQAKDAFAGSLAQGITQIAGGIAVAAAGGAAMGKTISAGKLVNDMEPGDMSPGAFAKMQSETYSRITGTTGNALQSFQGLQGAATGLGGVTDGSYQEKATGHSAKKQEDDAYGTIAQNTEEMDKSETDMDESVLQSQQQSVSNVQQSIREGTQAVMS
jgi:hypothetical protein